MGVIYKITNKINGKIYVGKRFVSEERFFKSNYHGGGSLIKQAIKKYGMDKFTREIIDCSDNNDILNEKEKYWIKENNCKVPFGYNLSDGGDGGGVKGVKRSPEYRKKISMALMGHKESEETKRKKSISHMGELNSRWGKPAWNRGKTYIELYGIEKANELKKNLSKNMSGRYVSKETRERMSIKRTARKKAP